MPDHRPTLRYRERLAEVVALTRHEEARFRAGDVLAPMIVCREWQAAGLPFSLLPEWVLSHLGALAAAYAAAPPNTRSLDRLAGLAGVRRRPAPERRRNQIVKEEYVRSAFDGFVARARSVRATGGSLTFPGSNGAPVAILDGRGRVTAQFREALAERFNLGGGWGNSRRKTLHRALARGKRDN